MPILRIHSLKCNRQEDNTFDDHTWITINDIDFWGPKTFDDGQSRPVGKDYQFNSRAEIKLFEYDDYDPNDYLGAHIVSSDEAGQGEKKANFSNFGASYDLWYEVIPSAKRKTEKELEQMMLKVK